MPYQTVASNSHPPPIHPSVPPYPSRHDYSICFCVCPSDNMNNGPPPMNGPTSITLFSLDHPTTTDQSPQGGGITSFSSPSKTSAGKDWEIGGVGGGGNVDALVGWCALRFFLLALTIRLSESSVQFPSTSFFFFMLLFCFCLMGGRRTDFWGRGGGRL